LQTPQKSVIIFISERIGKKGMRSDNSTINYSYLLGARDYEVSIYRHNERLFPFVSLTHVSEGEFYCEYNGETFVARKGETMYIPEGVLHNVYTLSPAIASWGHVSATSFKYDLMKNARTPVVIRGESSYTIKGQLDVLAEIKYDTVYALYRRDSCISGIFCELFKYTEACKMNPRPDWCVRLQDYITENVKEKFNLDELAKMLYISKSSLCHKFKETVGTSLMDYILGEKIKASFYLLTDGLTNRQIAERLNFSDEYYFSKLFKKFTGIPPKEYKSIYL
jgi:AraC-like DNA-binding protein